MGQLDAEEREIVTKYLAQTLRDPVRLIVFTDSRDDEVVTAYRTGESSRHTQALMEEIASCSDAVRLEVYDKSTDGELASSWGLLGFPTIGLAPADAPNGAAPRVRFVGRPGGYEFTSFLETLGSMGKERWGLGETTVSLLGSVDCDIDIKTFVTPT
jgi:alkyl hydroperoxide reductase subunit AhpF